MDFKVQFRGGMSHLTVTLDESFPDLDWAEKRVRALANHFARAGYDFVGIYAEDSPKQSFVRCFNLEVKTIITPLDC